MRRASGQIYDSYDSNRKSNIGYTVCAILCLIMVFVLAAGTIWVKKANKKEESVLPEFVRALDIGDYDEALEIYRSVHDKVVAADPDKMDELQSEIEAMTAMENEVDARLRTIEDAMCNERYEPTAEDIEFMNEMEELTSSRISQWLHDLCEDFLLGTVEKPDVIFIFDQMSQIGNVSASASPLLMEIEYIEMARGDVQSAESAYLSEDYVRAVQTYTQVSENYSGFVYDFSQRRIVEIKETMYEPMLTEGEHMLARYRYYSAEDLFSDMAIIFPDDQRINSDLLEATRNTTATESYRGTVEVLCVRTLIADISSPGSDTDYMLTSSEFRRMLEQLYANDYVLVDAETMADLSEESFITEVYLTVPEGKKPVVLVLDTFDYTASNYIYGCCERLVINDQGQVCGEYMDSNGQTIVSREAEAIGVLDAFIEEHPDFSFDGAKGVISLCGYESCFGYVISEDEIDDRNNALAAAGRPSVQFSESDIESNRATVSEIVNVLLDTGWKFASSTYGQLNAYESDMDTIVADTEKWLDQIGSLTGPVHMIVYPGGNYIYGTDERAEYLKENGFRIFFGMGSNPYYIYGSNYLYYDRTMISDSSLRNQDLSRLFDVSLVLDPESDEPSGEEQEPV
ncbi:MAG: hypothetical protein MJ103_00415 [Saccharofermentans sp.]|nr:hypothetical protein [Saccharofermentans sp.]